MLAAMSLRFASANSEKRQRKKRKMEAHARKSRAAAMPAAVATTKSSECRGLARLEQLLLLGGCAPERLSTRTTGVNR
jgi:hypothetical protein